MPRGSKICVNPKCLVSNGPRSFFCKACKMPFTFKSATQTSGTKTAKVHKIKKVVKHRVKIDWRTLKRGDQIKVKMGPYWLNQDTQVKTRMGEKGSFTVSHLTADYIHAYAKNAVGMFHIYMGPRKVSENGLFYRPHKIVAVKLKESLNA